MLNYFCYLYFLEIFSRDFVYLSVPKLQLFIPFYKKLSLEIQKKHQKILIYKKGKNTTNFQTQIKLIIFVQILYRLQINLKIQNLIFKSFSIQKVGLGMQYGSNIFSAQLNAKNSFLALLTLIVSIGLYHSLFVNLLKKYIERLFFATKSFQRKADRGFAYLLLTSTPMIILVFISLYCNDSLIGLEISMSFDEINILIVAGYICWIEQSRHTPIRGMHLIRDIIFALVFISLLINTFISKQLSLESPIIMVVLFVIYYFTISYFSGIQQFLMKLLGLKQSNSYNAKFLLTSKHSIPDFLEIKDLISQKPELIEEQLADYHQILANLEQNEEDQQILMNFAKLFLPIKKACEIKEQLDNNDVLRQIEDSWQEGSNYENDEQEHNEQNICKSPTWNQSSDNLGFHLKNTYTDDFINQDQDEEDISLYQKIIKYLYYPVYISSFADGRLFYLVGYVGLGLLAGSMYCIANSSAYFSYQMNSLSIVGILVSCALVYPTTKYYIQISSNNDYDFTNIFIQCMILKMAMVSIFIIFYSSMFSSVITLDDGAFVILIIRICVILIYLAFMVLNRFATRFSNFKFFCGLLIVQSIVRVLAENIYNSSKK